MRIMNAKGKRCDECGSKPRHLIGFSKSTPETEVLVCEQCLTILVGYLTRKRPARKNKSEKRT